MTKCTDNLTLGEIKELMTIFGNQAQASNDSSHWQVGKNYFIRTVTMIQVGKLEKVTDNELVLSSASWIAQTDRFMQSITEGKLKEVEPYGNELVIVGRGAIIDATIWVHDLPRTQK